MIDMHVHSTASDGIYSPTELVLMAKKIGVTTMALTDHDSVSGLEEFITAGYENGLDVIPGIELKAEYDTELHILGYFIDGNDEEFKTFLGDNSIRRKERNETYIKVFNDMGIDISYEEVEMKAGGPGSNLIKPHFASCLLEKGIINDVRQAYDDYFEKEPLKSIKIKAPDKKDVISAIIKAGGIAVLAHPKLLRKSDKEVEELITELIGYGLSGIEVYHSEHSIEDCEKYLKVANKYNLIVTGGTDFHGESVKPGLALGYGIDNNVEVNDLSIVAELKNKNEENIRKREHVSFSKSMGARAIIIHDNKILTFKRTKKDRDPYYVTIGGHRENGESLRANLIREVKEEIDKDAKIISLFATLEDEKSYQFFYEVELDNYDDFHFGNGDGTEFIDESRGLYEICFIDLNDLNSYNFVPQEIKDKIIEKYVEGKEIDNKYKYYIINTNDNY